MPENITQQKAMDWFEINMPIVFEIMKAYWLKVVLDFTSTESIDKDKKDPLACYISVQANINYPEVIIYSWLGPIFSKQIAEKAKTIPFETAVKTFNFEILFFYIKKININLRLDKNYHNVLCDFLTAMESEGDHIHTDLKFQLRITECLRLLVNYKAVVNPTTGPAPLHKALSQKNIPYQWIEILLTAETNMTGLMPVRHRPDLTALLIERGARFSTNAPTLLHQAAADADLPMQDRITLIDMLINRLSVNNIDSPNEHGNTALMIAIIKKQYQIALHLLKMHHPNISLINQEQQTALSLLQQPEHPADDPIIIKLTKKLLARETRLSQSLKSKLIVPALRLASTTSTSKEEKLKERVIKNDGVGASVPKLN